MIHNGSFVISLDYELLWGIIEKSNSMDYSITNIRNVHIVIDRLISLFEKYNTKATFATVGLLMCENINEAKKFVPSIIPSYNRKELSPYGEYLDSISECNESLYFSPDSIEKLKRCNLIEIGTHTFCHYYCWEDGQTIEEFEADIVTALKIAKEKNIQISSIIFPRNNVSDNYLKICKKYGIKSYRGNNIKFFSKPKTKIEWYKNRIGRFLESYIHFGNYNTYKYKELIPEHSLPVNIPASRFFRPYNKKLAILEPFRISQIKKEIEYAAINGEMYHLWWHPHNFGANIEENFNNLKQVLEYFCYCRNKYGMESYTMNELSEIIIENYGKC